MHFYNFPFSAKMIQAMVGDASTFHIPRYAELRAIQVLRDHNEHSDELVHIACDLLEAMISRADNKRLAPVTVRDFARRMAQAVMDREETRPRYRDDMLKIVEACGGPARPKPAAAPAA